jgi:hypothetical protein
MHLYDLISICINAYREDFHRRQGEPNAERSDECVSEPGKSAAQKSNIAERNYCNRAIPKIKSAKLSTGFARGI